MFLGRSGCRHIGPPEATSRGLSIDPGVVVQRRKSCRFCLPVPFSFTVIGAAESQLISKKVLKGISQNISGGGLVFETSLPLKVGDQLALNLHLSSSSNFDTRGWVVRSQPVENRARIAPVYDGGRL